MNYQFTNLQLAALLESAIKMFVEYRDLHGRTEEDAAAPAIAETINGLDAERGLADVGELKPTTQVYETVKLDQAPEAFPRASD